MDSIQHALAIEHWAREDRGLRGDELRAAAQCLRDLGFELLLRQRGECICVKCGLRQEAEQCDAGF